MKKILSVIAVLAITTSSLFAQSNLGFSIATSKSDNYNAIIWYQQQISERFSAGLQFRASDIKYRFINARAIQSGNTVFAGLTLGLKLKEADNYRLDFNTTASWRRINGEESDLPEVANGLEIDPNLIFGLKLNDQLYYHSGIMLRTTLQLSPENIGDEQLPSAIILNSLSYQLKAQTLSFKTYVGPMNGASGDTEKFFWQFALSYQYNLNYDRQGRIPFLNF